MGLFGQGSGFRLSLDGTNDHIYFSDPALNITASFTVEGWIKPDPTSSGWNCIFEWVNTMGGPVAESHIYYIGNPAPTGTNAQSLYINLHFANGAFRGYCTPAGSISQTEWTHIAVLRHGTIFKMYLNGVDQPLSLVSNQSNAIPVSPTTQLNGTNEVQIGERISNFLNYEGELDEFRLWNVRRSQTEIQEFMCQTMEGPFPPNLVGYWKMDSGAGFVAWDETTNAIHGSLMDVGWIPANWDLSGAPIGDTSTYIYTATWAGQSLSLTTASSGDIEILDIQGGPDGVHLYRVDAQPNTLNGIVNPFVNATAYYGSFVVGGTSPTHDLNYTYQNFPDALNEEPDLLISHRDHNADQTWADLPGIFVDVANDLIFKDNEDPRGEYLISFLSPLPSHDFRFRAEIYQAQVQLSWEDDDWESGQSFIVQRSPNGTEWQGIVEVDLPLWERGSAYFEQMDGPLLPKTTYYRLKKRWPNQMEFFSDVIQVTIQPKTQIQWYPNPANNYIQVFNPTDQSIRLTFLTIHGQALQKHIIQPTESATIPLSHLPSGWLYLHISEASNSYTEMIYISH